MIVLIRHGHTRGNESKTHYLSLTDDTMLLTSTGHADVRRLGTEMTRAGVSLTAGFTAPEERCRQTARILGLDEAKVDMRLRAQSWGGLDFPGAAQLLESLERWPKGLDARLPGGETAREVQARVKPLARELMTHRSGQTLGLVTHGVVINLLLGYWLNWPSMKLENERSIPPGSAVSVEFNSSGPAITRIGW